MNSERSSVTLLRPAQTNLDLYGQLHGLGFDAAQLLRIRDVYRLALKLFSDRYRANGKPFVAHLVGTASILAAVGARPEVVAAGLLHAAYDNGDFVDSIGIATAANRRVVRDCAGADVEELVAAYHRLKWNRAVVEALLPQHRSFSREMQDVLLMRLANEIEDHVGLGMRLCSETRAVQGVPRELHIELARALERPDLEQALQDSYAANDGAQWAAPLAEEHVASYRVASNAGLSGAEHLAAALRAAMRKLRRLSSAPG